MFQPPRMVSYQASDLQPAKDWYSGLLGRGPTFDSPMAVVFSIGDCALAVVREQGQGQGGAGGVAFWSVDDIDGAYRRLIEAGAEPVTEITLLMLRSRIARVLKAVFEAWRKTYTSEHVQFGIDEGTIDAFLSQRGFRLIENLTPQEIETRFLRLSDGALAGRVLALFNLAHASVVE